MNLVSGLDLRDWGTLKVVYLPREPTNSECSAPPTDDSFSKIHVMPCEDTGSAISSAPPAENAYPAIPAICSNGSTGSSS